jgi:hypothetical protein
VVRLGYRSGLAIFSSSITAREIIVILPLHCTHRPEHLILYIDTELPWIPPLRNSIARFTGRGPHLPVLSHRFMNVTDLASAYLGMDPLHVRDFKNTQKRPKLLWSEVKNIILKINCQLSGIIADSFHYTKVFIALEIKIIQRNS